MLHLKIPSADYNTKSSVKLTRQDILTLHKYNNPEIAI